jgi:glycosyltransferase involved in cell wall biosynthesis
MRNRIVIQQTTVGDYRQNFVDLLAEKLPNLEIICGADYFYPSLKLGIRPRGYLKIIGNRFLFGRRLLLQPQLLPRVISAEIAVLELNPRILTNWIALIMRGMLLKKTVLWGHAWPRGGPSARTDLLRHLMRSLASTLVVYTESQASALRGRMPRKRVIAAPNALYKRETMSVDQTSAVRQHFIYVGRLVSEKKIELLVRAFARALPTLPAGTKLLVIGDGPSRSDLERLVGQLNAADSVEFQGHVSDPARLAAEYARSIASVSPGYVGLSITQSLGFGVPMLISREEPHAPELEAAIERFNCVFFDSGDIGALAEAICLMARDRAEWIGRSESISEDCKRRYSAEHMAQRMYEAMTGK